jgi:uncharacterized protein
VSERFAPHAALAASLLGAVEDGGDGSHDVGHLHRVWLNARAIAAEAGGDSEILAAAVLLHDCVHVEKSSPLRAQASRLAAARAREVLAGQGWAPARVEVVAHAIAAHSFSAAIAPESLEARVMQDADRLDAIGAIGVARCFYTAGRMGSALYDADDPRAEHRALDDRRFAIDHFRVKLLGLADGFQTAAGARMAAERTRRIARFLAEFEEEVGG